MPGNLSQDDRYGTLTTPAGDSTLVLSRVDGVEGLSQLFEFHVEALSEQENFDFKSILGQNCCISLKTVDQLERYFNGVLVDGRWTGARGDLYTYRLVLKPWLWLLSRCSDCRIFSTMSVKDIIKKVFSDRGFSDFDDSGLTQTYPTLEYCVQYRETDLNFVCRLMEEYGIYYYFEHTQSKHTLKLADAKSSHQAIPGLDAVQYQPVTKTARRDSQQVEDWTAIRDVQTGKYVLNDYDYNKPGANLLADAQSPGGYTHDSMEMYEYPGDYTDLGEGDTLAKVDLDADQTLDQRYAATGSAPSLYPGALINLENHPTDAENREYIVVRCSHIFGGQDYKSGGGDGSRAYAGGYELTPSDRQFRAPRITPRAIVHGVQPALVVGKEGEEIDVDELGRICVQFYWDRKKSASRRVRVAQFWAGSHRGALFLPRIGDEVCVQYEDGDPNRPIVIGSVYNGANTVPADLPAKKTYSGILTKSSKNSSGFNMLLFDDTAGAERVKVQAEKDVVVRAKNDERRAIGGNQTEDITGNVTKTVGGNETIQVGTQSMGSYSLEATESITLTVGGSSITINMEGITLQAPMISFEATASLEAMAPSIEVTADAELMLTGTASVMINGGSILLDGPTVAPDITGMTPAGIPLL